MNYKVKINSIMKFHTSYFIIHNSAFGFGLIETIVAISLFSILAVAGATTVVHTFSTNRLGTEQTDATFFAQEGIEAVRSVKNQGWSDQLLAQSTSNNCSSGCGVTATSGSWALKTESDTKENLSRTITIE